MHKINYGVCVCIYVYICICLYKYLLINFRINFNSTVNIKETKKIVESPGRVDGKVLFY